ncbi:TetR/AcrR family transcriptional regulator [Caenimonas sp. SL110]|uniref:TetR/AcrR family transcriptional regulator n=1 Tax=Caenimonas sp. SL110 TaxID=1450524 RepID=UPI0009E4035E|nr:TetR/AcrR family transcriptional regulator [Caenimonas sp. SL110]
MTSRTPRRKASAAAAPQGLQGPPRRDPERTRAAILEAAVGEFSDHGYSGARTDRVAQRAGTNIRMLYHYFGSKDDLYVAVLEAVLADLRHDELQVGADHLQPLEGLLRIFDFVDNHFAAHPQLRKLLAFENLNEARHLARSARIPEMSTPVLSVIRKLLARGAAAGTVRPGIDALHLYVAMVSLAYYGRAHAFTLSRIFERDLNKGSWQKAHLNLTRQMVAAFLAPQAE